MSADDAVVCRSNDLGDGCGHPVTDHTYGTSNTECCCCTLRQNVMSHVDGCLDCAIKHAKRQVRIRHGITTPSTADVEPFIPEALKRAFWDRYIDRYFRQSAEGMKFP